MGSWHAQSDGFECEMSFAAEPAFDVDLNEPGSRRGAEVLPEEGPKVSERSEFFGPRQN